MAPGCDELRTAQQFPLTAALSSGSVDDPVDKLEALDRRRVARATDYGFTSCGAP